MKYILKQKGYSDEEACAKAAIQPGMTLYGYCGGRFGRDSYGDKVVIEVRTDSVVVEDFSYSCEKEKGLIIKSFPIYSWVDLINESNRALEEAEAGEKER